MNSKMRLSQRRELKIFSPRKRSQHRNLSKVKLDISLWFEVWTKRILSINFHYGGLTASKTKFMSLNRSVNLPLGESKWACWSRGSLKSGCWLSLLGRVCSLVPPWDSSSLSLLFLHFIRRFWNQILTWRREMVNDWCKVRFNNSVILWNPFWM